MPDSDVYGLLMAELIYILLLLVIYKYYARYGLAPATVLATAPVLSASSASSAATSSGRDRNTARIQRC